MVNLNVNFTARANFGKVGSELNKLTANIRQAQQQMAQAARAQGQAAAMNRKNFQAMNNAAGSFNQQVFSMRDSTDQLANSIRKGDVNFRQLGQALRNNQQITKRQVALQNGWVHTMTDSANGMKEVTFRTQQLSDVKTTLAQRVGTASAAFHGFSNRAINMGKNMQWAGRQIMVGLAVPLGFFAVAATKAAEEYDRAMTRVLKVTTFAAAEGTAAFELEVEALRRQVTQMSEFGTTMGFAASETAEAAAEFAQMGYQGAELDKLTAAAQQLAFTSGTELTDAIELTRITAMAFDEDLGDLTSTFAKLNMIENNTSLSLDDMATSMPVVAAVAHGLGVEIEEVGGLLAMMSDAGISAKEGATALRTGLIRIVQEASDPAIAAFETINLNLEEMQSRNKGDTLAFLDELGTHLQSLEGDAPAMADFTAAIGKLVGTRQASRFMTFLQEIPNRTKEGTAGFRAWIGATTDASEALRIYNFEYRQMAESQAGQADILRARIKTLMTEAGEPLLEFANMMRRFAVAALEWFTGLSEGWQKFIKNGLMIVAVVGPVLMLAGILQNLVGQTLRMAAAAGKWATGTRFLTGEQAALDAMLIKNKVTADEYTLAMARKEAIDRKAAAAAAGHRHNLRDPVTKRFIPAPRPERMGLGGIAATGVGVGAVAALITDVTQGTFEWHTALMQVGVAAMALTPLFKKIVANFALAKTNAQGLIGVLTKLRIAFATALGPLGLVVAALGAAAAIAWKWNKNQKEAFEAMPTAADDAERLAKNLGLAWNQGDGLDENLKSVEARMMEMRKENSHLIEDMKQAKTPFDKQQIIYDLGMQMIWAGNDPEEVARQLKTWAEEMDLDIKLELITPDLFAQDQHIIRQAQDFGEELGHSFNNAFETSGLQGIERTIVERQAGWVNKLISTADLNYIRDAGVSIRETMLAILNDPLGDIGSKNEALKHFVNELQAAGIAMAEMPEFGNKEEMTEYVHAMLTSGQLISTISEQTHLTTSQHTALINGLLNQQRQSIDQMIEAQRALATSLMESARANPLKSVSFTMQAAVATGAANKLEAELGRVNKKLDEVDEGAEEGFDAVAEGANKASSAVSALRSAVGSIKGNIASMAMESLQARHDAAEEALGRHTESVKEAQQEELEHLKETNEQAVENVEDRYNKQIDALKTVEEKEDELERQRQHQFRLQKLRDDYLQRKAQGSLNIQVAIARGDLDTAAMLRQEQRAEATDYNKSLQEEESKHAEETRNRQRDAAIEALETQRDTAVATLKDEQEAHEELLKKTHEVRNKQVEHSREAMQKQNEIIRRQFQYQLDQWKETTPRTEAEYQDHLNELGRIMGDFGGNLEEVGADYKNIFGSSIYKGFETGTTDAIDALKEDRRWEDAGSVIGDRIMAGLLGEDYVAPTQASGTLSADARTAWDTGGGGTTAYTPVRRTTDKRFHSGGMVDRSTPGQGLKAGESKAVLQTGEYVMDRNTVDRYGADFFAGLQRYHQGGLVDHIGDLAPLKAMSHTLGQVLAGRPVEETGNLGTAIHQKITDSGFSYIPGTAQYAAAGGDTGGAVDPNWQLHPGAPNLISPDGQRGYIGQRYNGDWRYRLTNKAITSTVRFLASLPGQQLISSAYRSPEHNAAVGGAKNSDHMTGKGVDFVPGRGSPGMVTMARWVRKQPGVRFVAAPDNDPKGHDDHVHISYYHKGGLVPGGMSIPALKTGANVNFDNTLANLHKGETVLTAPLSAQLQEGISQLASGGSNVYDIDINIQGDVNERNVSQLAKEVRREIEKMDSRRGPNRRMG